MIAMAGLVVAVGSWSNAGATPADAAAADAAAPQVLRNSEVIRGRHATSRPLRDIRPEPQKYEKPKEREIRRLPLPPGVDQDSPEASSAITQSGVSGPLVATSDGLNFSGLGQGDYGFNVQYAPPDTTGAVGATQYVQWVNVSLAVFDKSTGALIMGPIAGNQIFADLGGPCAANNDGDPVVLYDHIDNRWILSQFSVSTTPYYQCIAVSQTSDATGAYNLYAFQQPQFNDYPKMGIWPDAIYMTFNMFTRTFQGGRACAFDKAKMLSGAAATQVCFQLSSSYGGLLPADLDGATLPPAGSPNYVLNFGSSRLNLWTFHVDFATPSNSTFTGPTAIPVNAFTAACNGGTCIPQPGTFQKLDSLADRLMYRLAYRNHGGVESLLANHSVKVGSVSGVRWYELRVASGTPTLYQQGSYSPDSNHRWMGSVAMDKTGNIALGYSIASKSMYPSIGYTGRAPGDPPGTMQSEKLIVSGTGSQTRNLSRWGDYSTLTLDPVDDCTFWYTNEYIVAKGTYNWDTRVATFKFPSCQ
jgi:hypothetical protein